MTTPTPDLAAQREWRDLKAEARLLSERMIVLVQTAGPEDRARDLDWRFDAATRNPDRHWDWLSAATKADQISARVLWLSEEQRRALMPTMTDALNAISRRDLDRASTSVGHLFRLINRLSPITPDDQEKTHHE